MQDRTPSLYVSSRFRSSNLKNIGSECALNELFYSLTQNFGDNERLDIMSFSKPTDKGIPQIFSFLIE